MLCDVTLYLFGLPTRNLREARDNAVLEKDRAVASDRDTQSRYDQLLEQWVLQSSSWVNMYWPKGTSSLFFSCFSFMTVVIYCTNNTEPLESERSFDIFVNPLTLSKCVNKEITLNLLHDHLTIPSRNPFYFSVFPISQILSSYLQTRLHLTSFRHSGEWVTKYEMLSFLEVKTV